MMASDIQDDQNFNSDFYSSSKDAEVLRSRNR